MMNREVGRTSLGVIGALYILSGIWCAWQVDRAAGFLGLGIESSQAKAEFMTVYGGLQVGLGVAMWICARLRDTVYVGLLFSAVFSVSLLVFRLLAMLRFGDSPALWSLALLEGVIAAVLVWNTSRFPRKSEA